jgi:lactate permease
MLALAASLPIVAVFVLLLGLRWSAARAMSVGWVLASGLGLLLWRMEPTWWAASAVYGALQAGEIILIVFGAVLLMNHLKESGAIVAIRTHFTAITEDRRVQVLLIGLGFVTLIEGAAGFGTPGALAAPLMLGLGFPPLAAAVFGLVFNAAQPPFGAAGTPVIGGIGAVIGEGVLGEGVTRAEFLLDVTWLTAVVTGSALVVWGVVGVFLLVFWFGREQERSVRGALRATLPVVPLAILLGVLAGATQASVTRVFGPELPDIAAGFLVLGAGVTLARYRVLVPRERWDFPARGAWQDEWLGGHRTQDAAHDPSPATGMPVLLAWVPYLLVALVLIVTRWPGLGIADWLRAHSVDVPRILGQDLSFSLRYLFLPGVVPFIPVALFTAVLHRMGRAAIASAWLESARQIAAPAVTLVVAVSLTQVMIQSATNVAGQPGMMEALSQVVARSAGPLLPAVAPWIGTLGAFMTGSSTSSNVLFSVLQHDAAADVGASRTLVVALQNVGSGIGNMLAVLNIAAVCGVLRMTGMESAILRKALVPTVGYALGASVAGLVLARVASGFY